MLPQSSQGWPQGSEALQPQLYGLDAPGVVGLHLCSFVTYCLGVIRSEVRGHRDKRRLISPGASGCSVPGLPAYRQWEKDRGGQEVA